MATLWAKGEAGASGQVAVVTGASSGVGRAVALELARAGYDVVVHCRARRHLAEQVAGEIRLLGRDSRIVMGDLSDPTHHESLVTEAWAWRGAVAAWVNNAGADVLTGDAAHWSFEQKLDVLWRVDVVGCIRLSRLVGRKMSAANLPTRPSIVNVGWDQVEHGMAGDSGELFTAVKGAVMAFTKSLALSLAPTVRVNCVAPGWIRTAWGEQASEYWQRRAVAESLLGRWGTPEDVARVVGFLVSPAADYVTGQVLAVNGGFRTGSRPPA